MAPTVTTPVNETVNRLMKLDLPSLEDGRLPWLLSTARAPSRLVGAMAFAIKKRLWNNPPLPFTEIANLMGVTPPYARRMYQEGLGWLRDDPTARFVVAQAEGPRSRLRAVVMKDALPW